MGQKLVIVESPAKAKTIKKYLGSTYVVEATMGHVRDLPKSQTGVDIENNFEPKYITIRGKGEHLTKLKKLAKKSEKVYLATDPDREGEAISWHLANALKLDSEDKIRIEFNEITKKAVKNAIKTPRNINRNLVDAQQARRVLDRLVGYEISPILWRKVKWGLSAGRVQSVALRMICDREREIEVFVPEEYWTIDGELYKDKKRDSIKVKLLTHKGKKIEIKEEDHANNIIKELGQGEYRIDDISKGKKNRNPLPPFTTSTLQQDAYRKLNFSTKRTMSVAQKLYEGVTVGSYGMVGLITYMRTDSVRISSDAQESAKDYILDNYGNQYVPDVKREYSTKKNSQDAHEAIRPSHVEISPEVAKESLSADEYKLYKLIWNRFMASQMSNCILESTKISIKNGDYVLRVSGSVIKFDGFTKIYDNDEEGESNLPSLEVGEVLNDKNIKASQHFTQPPAKYSEASLVKTLEENGIGRPSTYAPTISTLLSRKYIERNKKQLQPTELGIIVNELVSQYFENIVDIEFTASMEENLDKIEEGNKEWKSVIDEFYWPFHKCVEVAEHEIAKIKIEDKISDVICEKCGRNMVIKQGRFGEFLACPGYPECENTKAITVELDVECPKCGGKVVARKSKKGRQFYGCSNYPECDYINWYEPVNKKCPNCKELLVKKYNRKKEEYLACVNKECGYKEEPINSQN